MRQSIVIPVLVMLSLLLTGSLHSTTEEIYCHVSLLEGDVYVIKSSQDEAIKAVVNYPLIPGDRLYTNSAGKCEIQFGNGTIIRLASHTDLRFSTFLSPSLTTNQKITTLQLVKGKIYSMNQVYREEIFQVLTPTAAVKMFRRSTNSILVNDQGDTHVLVDRGKVGIMYTDENDAEEQKTVGVGEGFWIKEGGKRTSAPEIQDKSFYLWNQSINRNFKDLHYGLSKVPQVIYRYSPGIVRFAERFSTRYGVWTYNELFGYVWKPSDESFTWRRPFWDANHVQVGGELYLIPNQPWGWAPAHLGTWFWSTKQGWIWIPGNAFSPGICSVGLRGEGGELILEMLSPYYWIDVVYGNYELYTVYRNHGARQWRQAYRKSMGRPPAGKKPSLSGLPANIRDIVAKMNRLPVETVSKHLAAHRLPLQIASRALRRPSLHNPLRSVTSSARTPALSSISPSPHMTRCLRDWNPDTKWSKKMGVSFFYSSSKNEVVAPKLGLQSRTISSQQKTILRRSLAHRQFVRSLNGSITNWLTGSNPSGSGRAPASTGARSQSGNAATTSVSNGAGARSAGPERK